MIGHCDTVRRSVDLIANATFVFASIFSTDRSCPRYAGVVPERQLDLGLLPAARPDEHPATAIEDVVGTTRRKIRRIRPPVKAHGGKYYLAPKIVPVLLSAPGDPDEYLEPCVFGGSVFLALPRFRREILGDVNPDVINL